MKQKQIATVFRVLSFLQAAPQAKHLHLVFQLQLPAQSAADSSLHQGKHAMIAGMQPNRPTNHSNFATQLMLKDSLYVFLIVDECIGWSKSSAPKF